MKRKKLAAILFSAAIAASTLSGTAQAAEIIDPPAAQSTFGTAQPQADVIVTKYRTYQGKFQKRRWNETRGYWVDPAWITIGTAP